LGARAHAAQIWEETFGGSGRGRGGGRRGEEEEEEEEEEEKEEEKEEKEEEDGEGDECSKACRNCFVVNVYALMPRAHTWSTANYGGIGL
jgi:hypothetical protein